MTRKIFRAICLTALLVALVCLALTLGALRAYFTGVQQRQLAAQTDLTAKGVSEMGTAFLEGLNLRDYRVTLISPEGTVTFDSQADAAVMENHLDREEVADALSAGTGESVRYSDTLTERLLYRAKRLPDGSILRLSCVQYTVSALLLGLLLPILAVIAAALLLSLLLASRLSRAIVKPLNALNLDHPLSGEGYDELSPLLRRIDSQQRQIAGQQETLRRSREEFDAITGSMSEGLVLLSDSGAILSINNAARRLFNAGPECVGHSTLTVNRSLPLQELLALALRGERAQRVMPLSGGEYQLCASPIRSDKRTRGAALLIFDVTEREQAEKMRREFTANVSHELKTPLHSISGCAELLLSGLVKPEDAAQFTGQIYQEAQRMITLVEDIIGLSRLDEGAEDMQREPVDLGALARDAVESLRPQAEKANVTLTVTAENALLNGIPQQLSAIVYNLCDNAIKYNRENGRVDVTVANTPRGVTLTVADTGIGIPPAHQSRVFERFYRVDKSHSREVGGTGLGLSIVKHAARLHGAAIGLTSAPGKGTTVTIDFPK